MTSVQRERERERERAELIGTSAPALKKPGAEFHTGNILLTVIPDSQCLPCYMRIFFPKLIPSHFKHRTIVFVEISYLIFTAFSSADHFRQHQSIPNALQERKVETLAGFLGGKWLDRFRMLHLAHQQVQPVSHSNQRMYAFIPILLLFVYPLYKETRASFAQPALKLYSLVINFPFLHKMIAWFQIFTYSYIGNIVSSSWYPM